MTRRSLISFLFAMLVAVTAYAGPARPGVHQFIQPDGTTISITLHGDEFRHWAADASGNLLETDSKGFYRKATPGRRNIQASPMRRRSSAPAPAFETTGERHIPVILVEYADVSFSFEQVGEMFGRMLNQEGYAEYGATGSVRDYYTENSLGLFTPVFDIYGPVRLERNMAAYGGNNSLGEDKAPEMALCEACGLLDGSIDFTAYDSDLDDEVDLVIFYFAGYDEAEYGPSDAIWSHQWNVRETENVIARNARFDGKSLGRYFCTSELSGNKGRIFKGIGSTCHEFGHSLGLPDLYDTDGTENGYAGGMYSFSLMSLGVYNNNGRTPPYLSILERSMLGWVAAESIPVLPEGDLVWAPVRDNVAYLVPSDTEGEYFIWEYRNGEGWDDYIPEGLLLYHIDKSDNLAFGGGTASFWWDNWGEYNNLDSYSEHPLAYIVPAAAPSSVNYVGKAEAIVYPGTSGAVYSDPVSWSGEGTEYQVVDIRLPEGGANAHIIRGYGANISGTVASADGQPIQGAKVSADISDGAALTGPDGRFVLELGDVPRESAFVLTVSAEGYRRVRAEGSLQWRSAYLPILLTREGESSVQVLRKYDASQTRIFYPLPSRDYGDCMGAVKFTPAELFRYVGRKISGVSFSIYGPNPAETVYVIVDYGGKRVLTREVEDPVFGIDRVNEVDISDANLLIPDGTDVFIGYGIKGSTQVYPLGVTMQGHPDNSFYGKLNLESSRWQPMETDRVSTGYMDLLLSADVSEVTDPLSLSDMGYASIDLGGKTWKEGESLPLKVSEGSFAPVGITWLFDGEITFEASVTLTKGIHTIQAILDYGEGSKETLRAVITCE